MYFLIFKNFTPERFIIIIKILNYKDFLTEIMDTAPPPGPPPPGPPSPPPEQVEEEEKSFSGDDEDDYDDSL